MHLRTLFLAAGAVAFAVGGCGGTQSPGDAGFDAGPADAGDAGSKVDSGYWDGGPPIELNDVLGVWQSVYGYTALRADGGEILGTHQVGEGTLRGQLSGNLLSAWWCETPTRMGLDDTGEVEFRFVRQRDGGVNINGRYRFARTLADGGWYPWNLTRAANQTEPADLAARFNEPALFCTHP